MKYTIENAKKAQNFTLFKTITPTRASVTAANAVSNRKYEPVVKPVLKYEGPMDHQVLNITPGENPPSMKPSL